MSEKGAYGTGKLGFHLPPPERGLSLGRAWRAFCDDVRRDGVVDPKDMADLRGCFASGIRWMASIAQTHSVGAVKELLRKEPEETMAMLCEIVERKKPAMRGMYAQATAAGFYTLATLFARGEMPDDLTRF